MSQVTRIRVGHYSRDSFFIPSPFCSLCSVSHVNYETCIILYTSKLCIHDFYILTFAFKSLVVFLCARAGWILTGWFGCLSKYIFSTGKTVINQEFLCCWFFCLWYLKKPCLIQDYLSITSFILYCKVHIS